MILTTMLYYYQNVISLVAEAGSRTQRSPGYEPDEIPLLYSAIIYIVLNMIKPVQKNNFKD